MISYNLILVLLDRRWEYRRFWTNGSKYFL